MSGAGNGCGARHRARGTSLRGPAAGGSRRRVLLDTICVQGYAASVVGEDGLAVEVRAELARVVISENCETQFIVLRERDGGREFKVLIGINEAAAIDRRLKSVSTARPMTHDLLASVIDALGAELEKIVVNDLREGTFYAKLVIRQNGKLLEVDSRPSDAIALGVGAQIPIYVEEHVLREAQS
jgi:bifunctional DNase/RNase